MDNAWKEFVWIPIQQAVNAKEITMQTELPPYVPSPLPAGAAKNNTMAIASLVLSIISLVSWCFSFISFVGLFCSSLPILPAIAALVTGFVARSQIKTSGERGNGMALAGIIMGSAQIVLEICGVIVMILLLISPSIGNVFSSINASLK
ncbi:MAG: DUF4190 domain-containing protein [Anaerolineales bacterium]